MCLNLLHLQQNLDFEDFPYDYGCTGEFSQLAREKIAVEICDGKLFDDQKLETQTVV